MKAVRYTDVTPTLFDGNARRVAGRVVIGRADGAPHFAMRVFEIGEGGHTPKHSHPWEHEMFYHSGRARCSATESGRLSRPAAPCSCRPAPSTRSATSARSRSCWSASSRRVRPSSDGRPCR